MRKIIRLRRVESINVIMYTYTYATYTCIHTMTYMTHKIDLRISYLVG